MPEEKRCDLCIFAQHRKDHADRDHYECRRYPPQESIGYRDPGEVSSYPQWPDVPADGWCGEFATEEYEAI